MDNSEIEYAQRVSQAIEQTVKEETARLSSRRSDILKEREYFTDYFAELKDDEKRDLLHNEYLDTNNYQFILTTLSRLAKQANSPYFAGFDFEEEDCEDDDFYETRFYLGIHQLRDPETGEYLVYDWRAPLASLYYEKEPGETYFEAPAGEIKGNLIEKRRYSFKKGKLVKVSKLNMPSDDEMLLEVLSAHSKTHMKTIVESIQAEQHRIIRDFTDGVSVLQGCAGSGKSSIALHKTAYIMYAFRKELDDKKIVIISPNEYFTEYISSVLPDLGENAVTCKIPENIVDETCANALDFDYLDAISGKIYSETLHGKERERFEKGHSFKCGDAFRKTVLQYAKYLENCIFNPEDLYYDENFDKFIPADEIKEQFEALSGTPVFSRIPELADVLCLKNNIDKGAYYEYICGVLNSMFATFSVSALYRMMYTDEDFLKECEEKSLPAYNPDKIFWEDACAIGVLTVILYGEMYKSDIFYMIADEAQDFSPIFLELLGKRFKGSNMLFVGDKNQTVFGNSGNYAEDIKKIIRKRPFRQYDLNTNYRSTKQISDYACKIAENESIDTVKCIREGEAPVNYDIYYNDADREEKLREAAEKIRDYLLLQESKGFEHAAVICSTGELTEKFSNLVNMPYESEIDVKYLPVYLAKGLEFDAAAVVLDDDNIMDRTSIYTACTRAMHNLGTFYLKKE